MLTSKTLRLILALLALLCLVLNVSAHPDLSADELVGYHENIQRDTEALNQCLQSAEMQEHNSRMVARHEEILDSLREAHGLEKRDRKSANKWAGMKHEDKHDHSRDPQDIFDFRWNEKPKEGQAACALQTFSTYGPYWHEGQPERQDIRDGQKGIPLRLAMRIIDINRCMPLHGSHVDIWQATSMGAYSGKASGYLRGWQPSSNQGTVDFDTIFPGHYNDRASHIHIAVRPFGEKRIVSAGMIYFDQFLRDEVERTQHYKDNKRPLKSNKDDDFIPYDSSDKYDPFVHWSRIGSKLEDGGLLAWITVGVNTTNREFTQPPNQKRDVVDWHLD